MRIIIDDARRLWAGIVIAILIPILLFRIMGSVFGLIWARRRNRGTFYRALMRAGLAEDDADTLTDRYNASIRWRDLLHHRRLRGH